MTPSRFDEAVVVSIPLRTRFRGIDHREAMLLCQDGRWSEWSPFPEYADEEAAGWLAAALEDEPQQLHRDRVAVNVTVPVVDPDRAAQIVAASGCRTAKVKVADPGVPLAADLARLFAVRDALGPGGAIRVDANGAWSVDEAERAIAEFAVVGLQYAEQPCRTVDELAELRTRLAASGVAVPIAADESIRRAADPWLVAERSAADVVVLKNQPLGGWRRCVQLAVELGLPVVISSALETSIGIRAGLQAACALPSLDLACGLNTIALFTDDVVGEPLVAREGYLALSDEQYVPDPGALRRLRAAPDRQDWWQSRLQRCLAIHERTAK